jgi:flagellar biogenesis protein FliO
LWPLIILVALVGGVVWLVLRRQRIKRAKADQAAATAAAQPLASQAGSQETPETKQ